MIWDVLVTNANGKTNVRYPIFMVPVTSLLFEKHVVSSVGSINTVKHEMSTLNNVNDVNSSLFIIVQFCVPCTGFNATWVVTQVCNDGNLYCKYKVDVSLSSLHNIWHRHSLPEVYVTIIFFFMVFDILT